MDLINQFIENYKKKLTFYENLGRISSSYSQPVSGLWSLTGSKTPAV